MKNINRNIVAIGCVAAIALAQAAFWERTIQGYLGREQTREYQYQLSPGEYTVDLTGSSRTGDLDCFVYDERGNLVGSDELEDNNPIVDFRVSRTGTYSVEVYNHLNGQSYSGSISGQVREVAQRWSRAVQGYLLRLETEEFQYALSPGTYRVDLMGRNPDADLDCFVYDDDGNLLGSDELEDNNPIVEFRVTRSGLYTIDVRNFNAAQAYSGEIKRL